LKCGSASSLMAKIGILQILRSLNSPTQPRPTGFEQPKPLRNVIVFT
jgi:hypothetical protein